ncbi:MAG: SufE family protein [Bacteroidia bacterium]|nr:SufE family protein [Bacteroidia bacterium]NNC85408.1 SufE family protein [Bacteroidia bacterium]NNM16140.1 SufE family protein [Bacteroidia bacterium]
MEDMQKIEAEIIEDFSWFDNWPDKYQYIIELGQKLDPLSDEYKTDEYKIKGCQSSVWIKPDVEENKIRFTADSDSVFVKGLVSLLVRVLSGQKAEDIAGTELKFIDDIGLMQHLAQTRANGLGAMIKQLKTYAVALQAAQSN